MALGTVRSARAPLWRVAFGVCGLSACHGPALDVPEERPNSLARVLFEPVADLEAVPLSVRLGVEAEESSPVAPWLVRGGLTENEAARIRRGERPPALAARLVPAAAWVVSEAWRLQPLSFLEPGESYALVSTGFGTLASFQTVAPAPEGLRRVFPPPHQRGQLLSVYCGAVPDTLPEALTLEPQAVRAHVRRGVLGDASAPCLTLELEKAAESALLPPPSLAGVALEPGPLLPSAPPALPAPCETEQVALGGACLQVGDDRLELDGSSEDLLVVLEAPETQFIVLGMGESRVLLRGLLPQTRYHLSGETVSAAGARTRFASEVTTRSSRRHLVLNEVLGNPRGPEPAAEWIELVNDGERTVSLRGVFLEDSGGSVALPDVSLEPGRFALLVSEDYAPSALDQAPASETQLVRLPRLGARGLTNSGEPLLLLDAAGVLSRFPLLAAPHAGVSIARRRPSDRDDDPRAFGEQAEGATPGAANTL